MGNTAKQKNILITRSKENAAELVKTLEEAGFKVFCEPLLTIEKFKSSPAFLAQNSAKISAAIITSSNACDALVESKLSRDLKIFSVGKSTSKKLTDFGFTNLETAVPENAKSLLELIKKNHNNSGVIAYFHGSSITLDFAAELKKSKIEVVKIPAYQANEIENFSAEFLELNAAEKFFDYVLIFSSKSAEIFLKMASQHNLLAYFNSSNLLCLSQQICQKIIKISDKNHQIKFANIASFDDLPILRKFYVWS